jgi:hypothetical protein
MKITITQDQLDEEKRDADFQAWAENIGFSHILTHAKSGYSFYEDPDGNLWEWSQMIDAFEKDSLTR